MQMSWEWCRGWSFTGARAEAFLGPSLGPEIRQETDRMTSLFKVPIMDFHVWRDNR